MGSNQTNVAKESQSVQNSILQASSQTCISDCRNVSSGNTIIFNGTNIDGNVDFNQSCTATASCLMKQQLQSQIQNIMSAMAEQTEKIDKMFISFNISNEVNSSEIEQNIRNSTTQTIQSACQGTAENIKNGNLVVLNNTNVEGSFSFGQDGNAIADCAMNNLAKQVSFNRQSAKQNQAQKIESIFALIAIAVIVVVIIGAIIVFITMRGKSKPAESSSTKGSSKSKKSSILSFLEKNPELLA